MDSRIRYLILSFNGYCYEVAGNVVAFFSDPAHCRECARLLFELTRTPVEIFGSQLSFPSSAYIPFRIPRQRRGASSARTEQEVHEDSRRNIVQGDRTI